MRDFLGFLSFPISDDFGRSQELVAQVAEPSKASLRAFTESLLFTWDGGFFRLKCNSN